MNEKIRELEAQCWEPRSDPNAQAAMGDRFNTEQFAELLIRDIMSFCAVSDEACDIIKKHYGVE
jgi:hypothetical protein